MAESSESVVAQIARRMRSSALHLGAKNCPTNKYADIARAIWPRKTAENWAVAAGKQPRVAKNWLRDPADVSGDAKLALIRQID